MGKPTLDFVDPRHLVFINEFEAELIPPFKPRIHCNLVHFHRSGNCAETSRNCFLDAEKRRVYCTDKGLKGGGTGGSKAIFAKSGLFYENQAHRKALERLDKAMKNSSPALAYQCSEVLFDCTDPGILMRVVEIVASNFRASDTVWAWRGTQGALSRIQCARLLRIAAVRVKLQELEENQGVSIMSDDQKRYSDTLESCVRRMMQQAKASREILLQAELRASWAVISSLKNQRDIRDWLKEYGPILASLGSLFDPFKVVGVTANAIAMNAVLFYNLMQKKRDRTLSTQVLLLASVDFAPQVTSQHVQLVKDLLQHCKRWTIAVLISSIVRKWLLAADSLQLDDYNECLEVLKLACSFKVFVFRSNWKVRSGALWNVVALHETSRLSSLKSELNRIIEERKTVEKDVAVLTPLEMMNSFRSAKLYLETAEVYSTVIEKEIADLKEFIETSYKNANTEQSEIDGKNYQSIIKKEMEKGNDSLREVASQNREIISELKQTNLLISQLEARVRAQTQIIEDLRAVTTQPQGKIVILPTMKLAENGFYGRQREILDLESLFLSKTEPKSVALVGPENMGKSWLAFKYAKAHLEDYDVVASLQADSASSIYLGIISLGKDLQCEMSTDKETLEAVKSRLSVRSRVLLIYDNADFKVGDVENKYQVVMEYMSLVFKIKGHILLTSRSMEWQEKMEIYQVGTLTESDASDLLLTVANIEHSADALELARDLECNPLAVNQAASYIKKTRSSVADFQEKFREKKRRNSGVTVAVLEMCLGSLAPEAKQLMEMLALLNGTFVPMNMIKGLKSNITDKSLMALLSDLRSAEFIDLDIHGVTVKRSFQELAQRLCEEKQGRQSAVCSTLTDMGSIDSTPSNEFILNARPYLNKKESVCAPDAGLAKTVADRYEDLELMYEEHLMRTKQVQDAQIAQVAPEEAVESQLDIGNCYVRQKNNPAAEKAFRDAIRLSGENLKLKVKAESAYGRMLLKIGDRGRAEEQLRDALVLSQGLLDMPDKDMADLATNYATLKLEQKQDTEALRFFQTALRLRRNNPKGEKEIMYALLNLAYFYQTSSIKDLDQAENLNIEALQMIREEKDKQKGTIYRNMAIIYMQRYKANPDSPGANELREKRYDYLQKHLNYRMKYQVMPTIDPETAEIYDCLADVHIGKHEYSKAMDCLNLALPKLEVTDANHPRIAKKIEAVKFFLLTQNMPASQGS